MEFDLDLLNLKKCDTWEERALNRIFLRKMRFKELYSCMEGHEHRFDHTTILFTGSVAVRTRDPRGNITDSVHRPPAGDFDGDFEHEVSGLGNIKIKRIGLTKKGSEYDFGKLDHGHVILVLSGAIFVTGIKDGKLKNAEYGAPKKGQFPELGDSYVGVEQDISHKVVALKDHTEIWCVTASEDQSEPQSGDGYVLVKAENHHSLVALEPNTEAWCVFAHRGEHGEVVNEYSGNKQAYV